MAKNKFWNFIKNEATETTPESVELRIDGAILDDDEAWIYEWFGIPCASPNTFRNELSQYKGKDITVWINSCGGDVFAAAGIYNALKEHDGKVTAKIDGKAMSAASVIAMAGDEILMSPLSIMMIHNPLSSAQGYASDLRKVADVLDTVKESIMNAYCSKTKRSREDVSAMMNNESYMDADTAIKESFADGKLYDEEKTESIMNFAFNRLSILNCASDTFKHLVEIESKNQETIKNNVNEEGIIVDLNELKNKYPDVYKAAYNEGKDEGIKDERKRIQGIDEISAHADLKLVNKAKYESPMDAKDLAMEIIKADGAKGQKYLNNLETDSEDSKVDDVTPALEKPDDSPENMDKTKIKNAANKIASYFRGGVK